MSPAEKAIRDEASKVVKAQFKLEQKQIKKQFKIEKKELIRIKEEQRMQKI